MNLFQFHTSPKSLPHYEDFHKYHHSHASNSNGGLDKKKVTPENLLSIKRVPELAYQYATNIIKKRWPEAEPFLKTEGLYWKRYVELFKL